MVSLRARQDPPQQDRKPKFEPDVDDSPVSSDAEEEESQANDSTDEFESTPRKRSRLSGVGPTLEEKLAQSINATDSPDDNKNGKRKRSDEKDFKSPRSSRKRSSKEMLIDSGDFGGDIFSGIRSSQQSYKRRSFGYGSKFKKTPSSSMVDSHPPSSAPQPKSSSTEVSVQAGSPEKAEEEEEEEEGFKFPKDIDTEMSYAGLEIPDSDDDSDLSELTQNSQGDLVKKEKSTLVDYGGSGSSGGDNNQEIQYLCPMCKKPVEPGLLILFQAQPKQRFRDQQVFCASHQQSSGEKEWKDKGYPTIDWEKFDQRIEAHFNDLEKLLVPDSSSYYRNVLDTTLKSGKAKNFRLTLSGDGLETISCGYYGTRGSSKILEALTSRFSRKLRRLAADDHIVKQAGVVGYTQAVLVPELAIKLIKEDMDVDDHSARQIMRESVLLGEKLNPAPNDSVPITKEMNLNNADGFLN
ncbi:RTC4-like domain-containing protein [Aspergillus spectabilis]